MDPFLYFVILFALFIVVWFVSMLISRSISKKKLKGFNDYIQEHLTKIDPASVEHLFAKQHSKQVRPDIMLIIDDENQEITIIQDFKTSGISHTSYTFNDLDKVSSSNQVISRGFLPKTYSYEETLQLTFVEGEPYHLILENVSNKHGSDKGADLVREVFAPWRRKLDQIIQDNLA